ncbi:Universal stress protein [Mycobacterium pseudokansasii]|uniref:Universal stress protein n=2 Tax=Mycobacterium pseudokansasii TaxID=2341080 RepID=A0A498QHK5_9MYCO|nr:Universal stress protein [Mycobacterium pseudokansasii]VBA45739.1 Universal stress protein [Mycobacterium pseudokansasii]
MRNVPTHLVHVIAPMATSEGWSGIPIIANYADWQEERAREIIEQADKVVAEATSTSRAPHVTSEVLHAAIVPALVDLSKSADMVVVGCRGQGGVGPRPRSTEALREFRG